MNAIRGEWENPHGYENEFSSHKTIQLSSVDFNQ